MRKPRKRVLLLVILFLAAAILVFPGAAWAPPPFTLEPGKDSQVFRPETPGYQIKKNRDRVEEYRKVPPPQPQPDQKKVQDKQAKEPDRK